MDQSSNPIVSDLKNLEKAVPRRRLIAYVAVIALLPALAIWAFSGREQAQAPEDASQAQETQDASAPATEGSGDAAAQQPAVRPAAGGGSTAPEAAWRPVVSADGKYQMDLPSGTKLTQDASGFTYVVPEKPAGALPLMAIKIATGVDKQGYKPSPTNSVMLDIGLNTYWLYTWQFKTWDPFARVVASFKVLK